MTVENRITESILFRRGTPFTATAMAWSIATDSAATASALRRMVASGHVVHLGDATFRKAQPDDAERSAA